MKGTDKMAKPKKLKNGMYSYRFKIKTPQGKWIDKYTTQISAKECLEYETKIKADALNGISPEKMLLIPYYDLWVDTFKKGLVSPDHFNKIKTTRKSLIDFFGIDITLKSIDRMKYQRWINFMGIEQNRAKRTVLDKHNIVKSMFDEALDSGYIVRNPARKAKIFGRDTTGERKVTLSIDEWKKLRDSIMDSEEVPSKYIALTMMHLGTRFQETTGLYKSDFDFKNHTVSINKAYDYKRSMTVTQTKTAGSVRLVDLPKDFEIVMMDYISNIFKNNRIVSISHKKEFLFLNDFGNPVNNKTFNKYLAKMCEKAKIPKITSHAFRHAKTDLLVLSGSDIIYTQKQLGHSDPAVTLRYYSSLSDEIRDKNRQLQDAFLENMK